MLSQVVALGLCAHGLTETLRSYIHHLKKLQNHGSLVASRMRPNLSGLSGLTAGRTFVRVGFIYQHHIKGAHCCSVGSHVRDAAAYVCWAFARAYESAIIAPAVRHLAPALLAVACYDREVGLLIICPN